MSSRQRTDKKFRKETRMFFRSKQGRELIFLTRQNGALKIAVAVMTLIAIGEGIIIIMHFSAMR